MIPRTKPVSDHPRFNGHLLVVVNRHSVGRYAAGSDFRAVLRDQLLAGKRIHSDDVRRVIREQTEASQSFEYLNIVGIVHPDELPRGLERMVQKMARGGVQTVRIHEMIDLVHSLHALYLRWAAKHGATEAEKRYEDLLARVRLDCVEAQVAAQERAEPFGPAMYEILLERVRARSRDEHPYLHGCRPEHLFGAAGVLTENCKTWWSSEFDVQDAS